MMIPATITVNFTPKSLGTHRICWRIRNSGNEYACTGLVDCTTIDQVYSGTINIIVDDTVIDPVIYEGYVQPTCISETSCVNQIPFAVEYVP